MVEFVSKRKMHTGSESKRESESEKGRERRQKMKSHLGFWWYYLWFSYYHMKGVTITHTYRSTFISNFHRLIWPFRINFRPCVDINCTNWTIRRLNRGCHPAHVLHEYLNAGSIESQIKPKHVMHTDGNMKESSVHLFSSLRLILLVTA